MERGDAAASSFSRYGSRRRAARRGALGREPRPERPSVGHQRGVARMVAEPDLRLGVRCRSPPLEVGDEGAGPPGVIARLVHEGDQHRPSLTAPARYPDCTMALHTKHPASAPPTAPARETTRHLLLRAWCVFVLFMALSGDARGYTPSGPRRSRSGWAHRRSGIVLVDPAWRVDPASRSCSGAGCRRVRRSRTSLGDAVAPVVGLAADHGAHAAAAGGITTLQALFVASVLTWRELVRAIASALKWVIGLSLLFELWVVALRRKPVMPGFAPRPPTSDPIELLVAQQPLRGRSHPGDRRQRATCSGRCACSRSSCSRSGSPPAPQGVRCSGRGSGCRRT